MLLFRVLCLVQFFAMEIAVAAPAGIDTSDCESLHQKYGYSEQLFCEGKRKRQFNKYLFRIRKGTQSDPAKRVRILLLGGFYFEDTFKTQNSIEDLVKDSLEKKGIASEVTATVPYFHVVSNSDIGLGLLGAGYSPDFIFYIQNNNAVARDFVENFYSIYGADGKFEKKSVEDTVFPPPPWLEWIWPSIGTQVAWWEGVRTVVALRSLRRDLDTPARAAEDLFLPTVRTLEKLKSAATPKQDFTVIIPRVGTETRRAISAHFPLMRTYLQPLVPEMSVSADSIREIFLKAGFKVISVPVDVLNAGEKARAEDFDRNQVVQDIADTIVGAVVEKEKNSSAH